MDVASAVPIVGGVLGIVAFLFTVLRVGFRTDELWARRDQHDQMARDIAVLQEQVSTIQGFLFHKAATEAKVKHAISERS